MQRREAVIIVPEHLRANDWLPRTMSFRFGGCTSHSAYGTWRKGELEPEGYHGEQPVQESVMVHTVAVPWTDHPSAMNCLTLSYLRATATEIAVEGKQSCVYLKLPTGDIELIGPNGEHV